VDGGQSQVGIESTVLDLTVSPPRILRPGMITPNRSPPLRRKAEGRRQRQNRRKPAQSGLAGKTLFAKGKIARFELARRRGFEIQNSKFKIQNSKLHVIIAHTKIPSGENFADVSVMPHDAEAFARALYAELHRCDAAGAELIVVEAPPEAPEWSGIADRLRRAAA
jgi:L-threonylcarbamoyladenylate synthase